MAGLLWPFCDNSKKERVMPFKWKHTIIILGLLALSTIPSYAQSGAAQQDAAKLLNSMPPDLLSKVRALAQILQQGIKDGQLTDAEIQQGMISGRLAERIKQLNPEAEQLLEEISNASKQGKGPGEESLVPLLEGLGISPNLE
jgi:hypothetical protein